MIALSIGSNRLKGTKIKSIFIYFARPLLEPLFFYLDNGLAKMEIILYLLCYPPKSYQDNYHNIIHRGR